MRKLVIDEAARLAALQSYGVLDTPGEESFDRLTRLAARLCGTRMATVTLVDEHRQWFKSRLGLALTQTPREIAFCSLGIASEAPTVVPDAAADARFEANPLVVGEPHLRFYACVPLVNPEGFALGTLAVMDTEPRTLNDFQIDALKTLGEQVQVQLELRRQAHALEHTTAERALIHATMVRQSEALQIAGRLARVGGWILELGAGELIWSDTVAEIHGLPAGRKVSLEEALAFYAPQWRDRLVQLLKVCAREGVAFDEQMEFVNTQGQTIWVRVMGQAGRDADGRVSRIHGALQDITQIKQAEQALARSEANFRELANAMPLVVWTATPEGEVDFVNQALYAFTTDDVVQTYGVNWLKSLHPDDVAEASRRWVHSVRTGEPYAVEYRLRLRGQSKGQPPAYRWYQAQAVPVRDADGAIIKWYGSNIDIHVVKETEQAMAKLARSLSSTLESITDSFMTLDRDWRLTYVNAACERTVGMKREAMLGQSLWELFPQSVGSVYHQQYQLALAENRTLAFEAYSDVLKRWQGVRVYPNEDGLVVYASDITERRRAEEALQESQRTLSTLMDNLPGMAYRGLLARNWKMKFVSQGAFELTGYPPQALLGNRGAEEGAEGSASEDDTGQLAFADLVHEADKERLWAEVQQAVAQRKKFRLVYRIHTASGELKWVQEHGQGQFDEAGVCVALEGIITDITELKLAEEKALRDARNRAEIVRSQQEITSSDLELPELLNLIAQRAMEVTAGTGAEVELVEGDHLVCRASVGSTRRELGQTLSLHGSLSGLAVREGQALLCRDSETDPRVNHAVARATGARAIMLAPLRAGSRCIGTLRVTSREPDAFDNVDLDNLQILVESLGGTLQRLRIAEQLKASEAQYRLLFNDNPYPMWVTDMGLRFLAVNRAAIVHYGYSEAEFLGMSLPDLWPAGVAERVQAQTEKIDVYRASFMLKTQHLRKDGEVIDVEATIEQMVFNGAPARLALLVDVTERLRVERDLARVSRAQRMLSACNEALIRAEEEAALLEQICRITVEIGGYRMAWVGFALDDATRSVQPVAHAGADGGFLQGLTMSWAADSAYGQGSVGRTVRGQAMTIVEDIGDTAYLRMWSQRALDHGFKSLISLPLNKRGSDHSFGVLCLYGAEVETISAEEKALLQELANDLAFGINNLRAQAEQRRVQAAVLKVSAAVSAASSEAFFEQLVANMAEALGAQAGYVARYLPDQPEQARLLAAVVKGRVLDEMEFDLRGTPCENLRSSDTFVVPNRLAENFARSGGLRGAQAYVGRRLDNARGEAVGLLFVLYAEPLQDEDFVVGTLQIFAARAAAELERLQADQRIRDQASLLDKARDAILVRDMDHRIQFWNKGAERMYGWTAEEAVGRKSFELLYHDPKIYEHAVDTLMRDGEWVGQIEQKRKNGSTMPVEARWTVVCDEQGQPQSVLAINTDITERLSAEREIRQLAFFDSLTGLPNRQLLTDRLEQALLACQRTHDGGALLFIDLDNFKTLNDTLGHDRGDQLLQQAAQRLRQCVREIDTVARFGGDEFVVMLESLGPEPANIAHHAQAVGEKVLAALNVPYRLGTYEHQCGSSIGIAPFTSAHGGVGELLRQADIAMYQAKAAGRNTVRFFDPGLESAVRARAALEADLRQALAHNEFVLHYQPQVDGQGRVVGAEALVRWLHPVRGLVSPADFIALAEETGLILQIGEWVLKTACETLARWADPANSAANMAGITLSVNVSPRQFHHPTFVADVLAVLSHTGASAAQLKLELTETLLVEDTDDTIAKMEALKSAGVGFSLDDFGTGYSSLSYLKRLPLDQLKIDKSFVRDVLSDSNDSAIARTIIALGHTLGLAVIAEGVETAEQRAFLRRHGCDAYQGYLFSRPLPLDAFPTYLQVLP